MNDVDVSLEAAGIGRSASISEFALVQTEEIGHEVTIGAFSVVRAGARLGDGVIIHPNVVIESGVEIGGGAEILPFSHIGKVPKAPARTLARPLDFAAPVRVGAGCLVGPRATIYCDVVIGIDSLVGDGASIRERCRTGNNCIIGRNVALHYNVVMGDRSRVQDLSHITGNTTIGSDVFVSVGVMSFNDASIGRHVSDSASMRGPSIEDGAAVGAGAILGEGVVIGRGAVVGAGALVSRDVAAHTMVVGSPARVIRHLDGE